MDTFSLAPAINGTPKGVAKEDDKGKGRGIPKFVCAGNHKKNRNVLEAEKEAIYLKGISRELGQEYFSEIELLINNRGAEQCRQNSVHHARTKRIDIRHHFVREVVANRIVKSNHVSTNEIIADILAKPLPRVLHYKCIQGLGLIIV